MNTTAASTAHLAVIREFAPCLFTYTTAALSGARTNKNFK